jgi:hypothetical protein
MKSDIKPGILTALNVDGCLCKDILLFLSYQDLEENGYLLSRGYVHFAEYHDLKINPVKSNGNYTYHLLHFVHTLYLRDFPCGFQDK